MRALFDIVHPADVHFFRGAMERLRASGWKTLVTSRSKDVTEDLLDAYGIEHEVVSRKGAGHGGLLAELVSRDLAVARIGRAFGAQIYLANNSPCAPHAAWLARRPSLVFDDTEIHRTSHLLYYPFVTEIHSPRCYRRRLGPKQHFYPGLHQLAYLTPDRFHVDSRVTERLRGSHKGPHILVRMVSLTASHDIGSRAIATTEHVRLVKRLQELGRVWITSEVPLPSALEELRIDLPVAEIHQLVAAVDLVVGESATMCAEAGVLGTPSILLDARGRGYTDDLEHRGLCFRFAPNALDAALTKAASLLDAPQEIFESRRTRLLDESIDLVAYQVAQIERLARL